MRGNEGWKSTKKGGRECGCGYREAGWKDGMIEVMGLQEERERKGDLKKGEKN